MRTVQGVLEEAVEAVTQERTRIVGSGRTDAGAHALGQVVAFSTSSVLPADTLVRAINAHLPVDVAVVDAQDVDLEFHPRFDARSRVYRYLIWNRPVRSPHWTGHAMYIPGRLDVASMNEAAGLLVGCHDFSAFVPVQQDGSRVRAVSAATVRREGDLVVFEIEATGFMKQMVRSIAGTLIRVGRGKVPAGDITRILTSKERTMAGDTAPAHGLYLVDVRYAHIDRSTTPGVAARRIEETA
jgi:tRNA pseudouridine38-40 synthase